MKEGLKMKFTGILVLSLAFISFLILGSFSLVSQSLLAQFGLTELLFIALLLAITVAALTAHSALTHYYHRPIFSFVNTLRSVKKGNLKTRVVTTEGDVLIELAAEINDVLTQVQNLNDHQLKTERELVWAQEELRYQEILEENTALIEEQNQKLAKSLKDLSVLYQVSQTISATLDPDELYRVLIDVVIKTLKYQEFALLVYSEETQRLQVRVAHGFEDNQRVVSLSFGLNEGISGYVARKRQPIYIKDTASDPLYLHYKGEKIEDGSFLSLPIMIHQKLLGVMNFTRPKVDSFSPGDIQLLTSLASQIAVCMENAQLYAKTRELSVKDDLTRVYNRRHFHAMLEMEWKRAQRFGWDLGLLMIDLDYFKRYNDTHGHLEGDRILEQIGALLTKSVREVDTVARYGGEEFAIILAQANGHEAFEVARKLCKIVSNHSFKSNALMSETVTISVGSASFPADANSIQNLIHHADIALYQAKAAGRNCAHSYSEELETTLSDQRAAASS